MWYVYLLKCNDDSLYIGITNNLTKRIATHNKGKGSKYTRGRLPVTLLYSFEVETKSQALIFEYKIKQLSKKNKLLYFSNKLYCVNNKETIKIKNDVNFILKKKILSLIRKKIKKAGVSVVQGLSYSVTDLRIHIESQFESWMNWNNQGVYNKTTWDDNDKSTWVWQLDHIIPHSTFNYSSMEDQSFKECWALSNLRPYSAKQNLIRWNK